MAESEGPSRRGRPRDANIDAQVLDAALVLLVEDGFASTTIQAIARRSGMHTSAIYRRWPSRIELIEDAIFPGFDEVSVRATGDLRRDLRRFCRAYVQALGAPAARAAVPGLLAWYQASGMSRPAEDWLRVSVRPQFNDILRAAGPASVDPAVDPDDAFDMLLGAVLARTLVPTIAERGRSIERMIDLVVRMLRPTAAVAAPGAATARARATRAMRRP